MFLLHYILPFLIFYFYRNRLMLWGLLIGNLIDLDHIYYRLIGKVGWFESACEHFGENCSIGFYPLHNWWVALIALALGLFLLFNNNKMKFIGWIGLGVSLNLLLDFIQAMSGLGFKMLELRIILLIVIIIESVTLLLRFFLKLKSPMIFRKVMEKSGFPYIIRIHHFFTGLIIALIAYFIQDSLIFNIGIGIALSDVLHHIILKIATGRSEFGVHFKDWIIEK